MGAAQEEDPYVTWPTMLARVARIVGRDAALRLARAVGGLERVRIPLEPTPHPWSRVLTEAEWHAVVAQLGGERVDLPRGVYIQLAKVRILELAEAGELSHREIALRCHVTERHVRRIVADLPFRHVPRDRRQLGLFGEGEDEGDR